MQLIDTHKQQDGQDPHYDDHSCSDHEDTPPCRLEVPSNCNCLNIVSPALYQRGEREEYDGTKQHFGKFQGCFRVSRESSSSTLQKLH